METATVGEKSIVVLSTLNFNNQPCKVPMHSITCDLESNMTGTKARGSVKRSGRNQYEISYQPTTSGEYQLHIKVEGQHIKGSPFLVIASDIQVDEDPIRGNLLLLY